ncbi:MAG: lipoyl(octanoyl) transferase LipB [Gemmatimonadota bacterium]
MEARGICKVVRPPGLTDYAEALAWQRTLAKARASGDLAHDLLILLQHPHVITLGRGAHESNLTASPEMLQRRDVAVHEIERGGDVTYHGPGQLVGYPILDLNRHKKDLHWYLRRLEQVLIDALAAFGVEGTRIPELTGVWIQDRKIASIGVHVTRWVTFHGFALNVSTDLSYFELIIPCGIDAVKMTSIKDETSSDPDFDQVLEQVSASFGEAFGLEMEWEGVESLLALSLTGHSP